MKIRAEQAFDHAPRPLSQRLGAILWPSFFSAGVATMILFAHFDPIELRDMVLPDLDVDRGVAYTVGFFLLWGCTAASSLFTWFLLRPPSRFNPPTGRMPGR